MELKIFDNALEQTQFEFLKSKVFGHEIPWFYGNTAYKGITDSQNLSSFEHLVIADGQKNSTLADLFELLLKSFLINNGFDDPQFLRMRLGLIPCRDYLQEHEPHVDYPIPHYTGLLYFNKTDANTKIFKEKYDFETNKTIRDYLLEDLNNNLVTDSTIEPIENRIALFDGLKYHSSAVPTTDDRMVMTFNYVSR